MATSYGTIIGHPDYAKLPPEKKQSIAQQYWKDDPLVVDAVTLIQPPPEDLSSIQQKAFDDRRKISALRIAAREPEAAQYADKIGQGITEAEENLTRLNAIYTPEAQGDIEALVEPAKNTGWYGSVPLENQLGRVGVGYSPEQYQEIYNSQRDATAQKYGLTTEQLDDVVRHQMDAQEKPVSRDALGRVHIKNDVFIQGLDSVKKNVEDSDLPASVKSQELEGIDDRYKGFQETVVANTLQNHKDYAKEIGLDASKSVEENFKKIGESLNTSTLENEFSSAVQATRQGGASVLRGLGTVAEAISPEAAGESGLKSTADALDQRKKIFDSQLALSKEFNNDKLSIFGLTPGAIGQGIGSVAESAVIARATGGIIPRVGGAGKLAGYLNSVRGVAPTAAIIGTRTGLQTYDDAIKQGLSEEDATRAGLASGIIEAGTTLAFTAAGAGGIEDIASGMKKAVGPAVKSAFGAATKDVAKNTLGEVTEESIINALDQALVQTTVQPGMTTEQFLQSVKDTAVSTLIAGGPITAASGVATYQQTNEQLRVRANEIAKENLPALENEGGVVAEGSTPSLAEERAALIEQLPNLEGDERLAVEERIAEIDNELPASENEPVAEETVAAEVESPAQAEVPTDSLPEGQTAPSDQGGVVTLNEDGQEQDRTQTETPTLEQPVEQLPNTASQESVVVDDIGRTEIEETVNEQETQNQNTEEAVSADGGLEPERLEDTSGELETTPVNDPQPNPPTPAGTGVEETTTIPTGSEQATTPTTPPERPNTVTEEPELVGPRKSINTSIRRKYGLGDPTVRVPQTTREAVEAADAELERNPDAGRELITSLEDTGRIANAKETALLSYEFTRSVNELERAEKRLQDTSGDAAAQRTRINDYELALANFDKLSNLISTNASEASFRLNAQKILRRKNYSYEGMVQRGYAAKNRGASEPTPLTKEERAEIKKQSERILELEEELVVAEQQAYAKGRQDAENDAVTKSKKVVRESKKTANKKTSAQKIADLTRKAKEAQQRLNERFKRRTEGGQLFSGGITEEDIVDVAIIATSYIRAGAVTLKDFTTRLVEKFGESARQFADRIFEESNALLNGIARTPEQLVAEMDPSKPINRQSVNLMVKSYLEEDLNLSAQDVVTKLQSDLKAKWPDITRNQASDAWTGYGQPSTRPQTRSEVQRAATDLRRAALLQRQVDDLKAGKYNKKTRTPAEVSDEVKRLTDERDELMKGLRVEERTVAAINRSRAAYEKRLRDGDFTREKKEPLDTEAVRKARFERDKAKAEFDKKIAALELANYGKWQKFLRTTGAAASLLKMVKLAGDLGNFFRNVGPYTLKMAVNPLSWRKLFNFYRSGLKSLLSAQNEYDIYNAYNNHPLIQQYGGADKLGLKLVNPFDESSMSQEAGLTLDFVERLAESQTARNLGVGKLAQLSLAIERANRTWATSSRAEMFMQFANLESNRQMSAKEAKNLAQAINIITGYGGLSQDTKLGQAFEKAVPFLNNTITLSARWAAAKIQYGLGVPIWNTPGYANKARMIRDVYAINFMGRVLLGAVAKAIFIAAKGDEFPDDPEEWKKEFLTNWNPWDSENGGGLKFDGTKISFDSGNDAFLSLLAKSIPYYKDGTWERREIKNGKWTKIEPRNLGNKWTSYFANRMNPVTSSLYRSFIKGQNYDGKPLNLHTTEGAWNMTKEWFQPIIASDIDKIYKNHGMEGVLIFLSAFHGANVRFKPGPKKSAQSDRFNLR